MRKFTENVKKIKPLFEKIPIDPLMDVEDFIDFFKEKKNLEGYGNLTKILDQISVENPTQTNEWDVYEIYENNQDGRWYRDMFYVRAVSKDHARVKGAIKSKDIEIITTGFYGARKIDPILFIRELEKKLKKITESLSDLKDPF